MIVLLTCKNEEDPVKNEGARVLTRLYINFSDTTRAANSAVSGGNQQKIKLIQAFQGVQHRVVFGGQFC